MTTRIFQRLLREEEGSGLTEFAIMVPSIMIIFLYSIFFTDMIEVKLKTLEASRFMTWESTVYRDGNSIKQDMETRFANLRSTDIEAAETLHMIGIENVRITNTYTDALEVDMTGGVPDDDSTSEIGGIDATINSVLAWMNLPTRGKARSEVTFQVDNKIVPDFMMFNTEVRAQEGESEGFSGDNGFSIASHHVMIYDTWKGWPNKNRRVGSRAGQTANPMQTYDIAESALEAQLRPVAYFKLTNTGIMDALGEVFAFFGLPEPITVKRATTGPTTMRAPAKSGHGIQGFSPTSSQSQITRFGHRWGQNIFLGDNPNPGIDHSRWSLPYSISKGSYGGRTVTWWHQRAGGMVSLSRPWSMSEYPPNTKLYNHQYENDYFLSYGCRGHYYDGYVQEDGEPGDYRNYDGCGDGVDAVQGGIQDLLNTFGGGFQLPGF
ncbi:MAG: hypothetical protein P1V51_05640 [Deltaproteobacteria bacterium]|nr:hypothetical protein [Deltaproteobacteria bacterium]